MILMKESRINISDFGNPEGACKYVQGRGVVDDFKITAEITGDGIALLFFDPDGICIVLSIARAYRLLMRLLLLGRSGNFCQSLITLHRVECAYCLSESLCMPNWNIV